MFVKIRLDDRMTQKWGHFIRYHHEKSVRRVINLLQTVTPCALADEENMKTLQSLCEI